MTAVSNVFFSCNIIKHSQSDISVGAGTAGSLLAHRIATETNLTFVVLEAGGRSYPLLDIPFLGPLLHGSIYDWQYETTPQENACFAMVDKVSIFKEFFKQ